MIADRLRKSVLQAAMEGKLTEQLSSDKDITNFVKESELKRVVEKEKYWMIPENWGWIKFSDLVDFKMGKTPERSNLTYWGKDIPWISIADMNGQPLLKKTKESISKEGFKTYFKNKFVPKGTLIMSFKLTVGRVSILDIDALHNEAIISIFPKHSEEIQKKYLFYILPYISNMGDTKDAIKGKTLNSNSISNLLIPVPHLEEQIRIVEKLEKLIPLIDNLDKNEKELKLLEEKFPERIKNAILQSVIRGEYTTNNEILKYEIEESDTIFNIPKTWQIKELNEVATLMTGNSIPVAIKNSKYTKVIEGYSYIATKDVGFDNEITYENGVKIPFDENNFRVTKKGNILLCIEGGSAGKKIGLLDRDVTFGNKLCSFESYGINNEYLFYFIQSSLFQTQFNNSMTGMIGGVGINKIRQFKIPIPPYKEQKEIVDKIRIFFDYI